MKIKEAVLMIFILSISCTQVFAKVHIMNGYSAVAKMLLVNVKPDQIDSDIWNRLASHKKGDEGDLISELEAVVISAGVKKYGEIEKELLKILSDKNSTLDGKEVACRLLQRVGSGQCVPVLAEYLYDENMSHYVRLVLQRMPESPEAVNAMRHAVNKSPDSLKPGLIGSLAEMGHPEDVQLISQYISLPNTSIASTAIIGLGKIGNSECLRLLQNTRVPNSLMSLHLDAMMRCAEKLDDISVYKKMYMNERNDSNIRLAALKGMLRIDENSVAQEVVKLLHSSDSSMRSGALQMITMEPGVKLTAAVCAELPKLDPDVQIEVISALGTRGDSAAFETLSGLIQNDNIDITKTAIVALGGLNNPDGVKILLKKMKSPETATAAKESLGVMTHPQVHTILVTSLKDRDLALEAINALAHRMSYATAADIVSRLNDVDADIRQAAWNAISEVASSQDMDAIMKALVNIKDEQEIARAAKAVIAFVSNVNDKKSCFDVAIKYQDHSEVIRYFILDLAALTGTSEALEVTKKACFSDNEQLRAKAIRALCKWRDINAASTLLDLSINSKDDVIRILTLRGYIRLASLDWRDINNNLKTAMDQKYHMLLKASEMADRTEEKMGILSALSDMGRTKNMRELHLVVKYLDETEVKTEAELAAVNLCKQLAKDLPNEVAPIAQSILKNSDNQQIKFHANKALEMCQTSVVDH